jgi:hypothetical protein
MLTYGDAAVACDSSIPEGRVGPASRKLHIRGGYRTDHSVSALVAGVREAAGYLSGRQTAADTSPATCAGHQPSGRRSFREAADGQSADRSV